ncbi:MAG: signal peptidase II [Acidimicrobiales bacterium]|nr:signal peptidase II [Acidimicrobiales bacterium]MEC9112989.1 signal peptidase II [Actinomycetota bacterium]
MAALRKVPSGNSIALIALLVAALDQLTKSWAVNALDDRTIGIVWKLQFHLTSNTGFAFSTGQGLGPILGVIALGVMVVLWKVRTRFSGQLATMALGFVLGGASGNLLDRAFRSPRWGRGAVVDFIDLQFWPVFNLADAAIVIGVIALSLRMWIEQREGESSA